MLFTAIANTIFALHVPDAGEIAMSADQISLSHSSRSIYTKVR
jgi:hypothetical protein